MKILFLWLALGGVAAAAPTAADLERVLGGYEHSATADELARLGAGTDLALIAYASDAHTTRVQRMKAIVALRHTPSSAARAFLETLLVERGQASQGADALDVAAALGALTPYGDEVVGTILPYLTHPSADLRQSAAAALGRLGAGAAAGPLRARLTVERDASVRVTLRRALQVLRAPPR